MKTPFTATCASLLPLLVAAVPAHATAADLRESAESASFAMHAHDFVSVHVPTADELIAAIQAANSTHRPTRIHLSAGKYGFSRTFGSDFGGSALPPVTSTIIIEGKDAATTSLDNSVSHFGSRYLTVLEHGHLLVRNLTLTQGSAICQLSVDCPQNGGGAAQNAGGELIFEDCVLTDNGAFESNGDDFAFGGAIFNLKGRLRVERTTISANVVAGFVGGIAGRGGTATIRHSIISGNSSQIANTRGHGGLGEGGGIYVANADLSIHSSTIAGNQASASATPDSVGFGGGIFNEIGGRVWLTNSSVIENVVHGAGGGGGIQNNARMTVESSTVGGNTAGTFGGGISNSGALFLQGVTLTANFTDSLEALDFEGNVDFPSCAPACLGSGGGLWDSTSATVQIATAVAALNQGSQNLDCDGVLVSEGHNALGTSAGCTLSPSPELHGKNPHDQINLNPGLADLLDNGEPGEAHYPLLAGSPVIDTGGPVGRECTRHDQIGESRVNAEPGREHPVLCDVGAIEYQPREPARLEEKEAAES